MSDLAQLIGDAIASRRLGPRMWLYSNYHCNLACRYCLTGSSPTSDRRMLDGGGSHVRRLPRMIKGCHVSLA